MSNDHSQLKKSLKNVMKQPLGLKDVFGYGGF